ncbi:hypothetical protein Lsed01_00837 [Demequina sediminis]|uniref:Lipoprotein n=1 Tax=Demequina sediminis TaxID=1930058 RepID=A0ABP9WEZ4_9MICO|nr:hypothetical protein [Demequina sediminis]BDZ62508.1 hypothetical protein GCM10025873_22990 [Demequina sediminis]
MNINILSRKIAAVSTAGALALALSACGMGNGDTTDTRSLAKDAQPEVTATADATPEASATPEATVTPDVAFEHDNGFNFDASTIAIPEDVTAVFGDDASRAVNDALMVIHEGYVQNPQLVVPGYSEADYDIAWEGFSQKWLTSNVSDEDSRDYIFLSIDPDGVLGTIDGTDFTMPADGGVEARLFTEPVAVLSDTGDAVSVGFDVQVTYLAAPSHVTQDAHITLKMIPAGADGQWMVDGFTIATDPAEVVEG